MIILVVIILVVIFLLVIVWLSALVKISGGFALKRSTNHSSLVVQSGGAGN